MKLSRLFESPASMIASYRVHKAALEALTLEDLMDLPSGDNTFFFLKELKQGHDYLSHVEFNERLTGISRFVIDVYLLALSKASSKKIGQRGLHKQVEIFFNHKKYKFFLTDAGNETQMTAQVSAKIFPHDQAFGDKDMNARERDLRR